MAMEMEMEMEMEMGLGTGPRPSLGGVAAELQYRPMTLQFPLSSAALPAFPPNVLPASDWKWSDKSWDPDLESYFVLLEFLGTPWQSINFDSFRQWDPSFNPTGYEAFVNGEIQKLLDMMRQERERYLSEICSQQDSAAQYWPLLLRFTRAVKPATHRLIRTAVRVGELAVVYYKNEYKRPRASTVCPGLFPPFGPPGHPAFPSGHSTQSWLITFLLGKDGLTGKPDPVNPTKMISIYEPQLEWLAERVAVNRERAGFHYPTDTAAGKHLAQEILTLLKSLPAGSHFQTMFAEAKAEW